VNDDGVVLAGVNGEDVVVPSSGSVESFVLPECFEDVAEAAAGAQVAVEEDGVANVVGGNVVHEVVDAVPQHVVQVVPVDGLVGEYPEAAAGVFHCADVFKVSAYGFFVDAYAYLAEAGFDFCNAAVLVVADEIFDAFAALFYGVHLA